MFRRYLALVAALLVVVALAAPAAAAEPTRDAARDSSARSSEGRVVPRRDGGRSIARVEPANGTVGVTSVMGFTFDDESGIIVGEVKNNTTARRESIQVEGQFFNSFGQPVGEPLFGTAWALGLAYGSVSPFFLESASGAIPATAVAVDAVVIDAGDSITTPPVGGLTITPTGSAEGTQPDTRDYTADVRNPNGFAVEEVYLTATSYDADGDVTDSWVSEPFSIAANGVVQDVPVTLFEDVDTVRVGFFSDGLNATATGFVTSWNNYFNDVGNISFRRDIEWLVENRITSGCGPGRYCPANNVRRDEMASFLSRALGLTGTPANAFVDDNGNTHELAINRIFAAGITSGCNPAARLYCPSSNVRRDEMASFLSRALGLTGTPANAFNDDNGNTHELNINRVAAAGVTTGCNVAQKLYCPTQNVTRGQMAAFLRRAFEE